MPYFDDAQAVYDRLGRLLQEAAADEELGPRLQELDTVLQYRLRNPDSQVTLQLRAGQARAVELGPTQLQAEVVVGMDADTAHELWVGELNPTVALAKGRILAKGPVSKILRLVPLYGPLIQRYRAQAGAADPGAAAEAIGDDDAETAASPS
jgi:putative sterol carrier protein